MVVVFTATGALSLRTDATITLISPLAEVR
jgi:hypothetical protein